MRWTSERAIISGNAPIRDRPERADSGPFRYAPSCALIGYGITDGGSADQQIVLAARRPRCATRERCRRVPLNGHSGRRDLARTVDALTASSVRHAFVDKATVLVLSQVVDSPAGWECCRRPIGAATPS